MAQSLSDAWKSWLSKGGSTYNTPITPVPPKAGGGAGGGGEGERGQSPLEWGIDIISRPLYAVMGGLNNRVQAASSNAAQSITDVRAGRKTQDEAWRDILFGQDIIGGTGQQLEAAWRGLTSTDYADKKTGTDVIDTMGRGAVEMRRAGGEQVDDYEPPTFENVKSWGDYFAAAGRGAGGFALDVGLDPLSYTTFGVAPAVRAGVQGVRKLLPSAERRVTQALRAGEEVAEAAPASAVASEARRLTPTTEEGLHEFFDAARMRSAREGAPPRSPTPAKAPEGFTAQVSAALKAEGNFDRGPGLQRTTTTDAKLPKVSETINSAHSGVVAALLKTERALADAAKKTPTAPTPKPKGGAAAAPAPAGMGDFARQFFGEADEVVGQLRMPGGAGTSNIFPSNIIKGLSSANPQQAQTYWRRLVAAAQDPKTTTPQLREFLSAASRWAADQKAARAAAQGKKGPSGASAPAAESTQAVEVAPASFLSTLLKTPSGKPTALGKELRAAVGPKVFSQLAGKRTNEATRSRVLDELLQLAKNADEVSPTTFDGMHENVRRFVEDTLQLRREDFDLVSRQKVLEQEMYAARPRLFNKETARGMDPAALADATAATGLSAKMLQNHWETQAKKIAGAAFDPKKNYWQGGTYHFTGEGGVKYAIADGKISTHAFMDRIVGAVKQIDEAIPIPTNTKTGKPYSQPPAAMKTSARRAQLPARMERSEIPLVESGVRMGVNVGDEFVVVYPSHIYRGAEDFVREAGQTGGRDAATAAQHLVDDVLYNPGTSAPYSNMIEAVATSMAGGDRAVLDGILRQVKGKNTGINYSKRTQLVDKGGRSRNQVFTAEQLRARTIDAIERITPFVQQRANGALREFFEKTTTDASAIATTIERESAEATARAGEGGAMAYAADIERRVIELGQQYGASGYALGLATESLAKEMPPWMLQQAKQVRSTQTAYVNAARAGATMDDMRKLGAASEAKHTPVSVQAAIDDSARLADDFAEETGEQLWGMGSQARSVLKTEIENASLLGRAESWFRSRFDQNFGGVVDGIQFRDYDRYAAGLAGKPIVQRGSDIAQWARKHDIPVYGPDGLPTKETVSSTAFKLLQDGAEELPPELLRAPQRAHVAQALEELKPIAGYFFDVPGSGLAGDKYWRGGAQNMRYLEEEMRRAGMQYDEVFEKAALDGELQDWWRNADVSDPGEFLHKYNEAVHRAEARRASMMLLTQRLREGGLISTTAKPGFAKPSLQGDSFFYAGLQDAGVYIDKRALEAMSEVDKMIFASRGFKDSSLITTAFDPVLSAWKTGMTIMRPGHHVRNTLSNGMLSFVDQGMQNLQKSGIQAARLMALREGDRGLAGISEAERLLTGASSGIKSSGGQSVIHTATLRNGKKLELTLDDFNDAFTQRGFFRTYQQSEDIVQGAGKVQKLADAVALKNTKGGRAAGGLSEVLDHHGYVQHAMQIVMNNAHLVGRRFKTLDDLFDYATQRSFRFHPDSNVLTPFESKYMRRLFGFYTWFKGTLPAVITSTIKSPGRVAVAHKASFNIAEMFGLDPQSYDNPWPEDAEVPDYLKEGFFGTNAMFGDQMYSLNPGFAHNDLLKMFFGRGPEEGGDFGSATLSNAGRELLGMMNPLFKAPIELTAGVNLQTGRKIRNSGDYVDSQLPHINYLTKGSGIGFTNNVFNPAGAIAQGRPHQTQNVEDGYQPWLFEDGIGEQQHRSALNWLFGQSGQKINTVEQEAAADAAREARLAAREGGDGAEAPAASSSGAYGAASSGSGGGSTVEALLGELNLPRAASTPTRAALGPAAVDSIASVVMGANGKPLTASQRLSWAKALQAEALGQQSSMYWTDYANRNLEQLAAANPNLSIEQLLAILKSNYTNPYAK